MSAAPVLAAVAESPAIWIGPPPEILPEENVPPERMRQLIRKFDPAERDARNRKLGKQGEELVYLREQHELRAAGREDLARKVEWTSEVRGDGAGYDVRSFEPDGRERLIEVKTTNGPAKTPFFLSENERLVSEERKDAFALLRLYSFVEKPSAFELRPPLSERLALSPTNYRASLNSMTSSLEKPMSGEKKRYKNTCDRCRMMRPSSVTTEKRAKMFASGARI